MRIDLNEKYRPKRFADFWNQGGAVQEVTDFLRARSLPKAMLFRGSYGTGKTSLGQVIAHSLSCLKLEGNEPCGECQGCIHCFDRFMGLLGCGLIIHGNKFQPEVLEKFAWEAAHYLPPECSNSYVVIIDEFQRLTEKEQDSLLHVVEETPRTHFIICTTNKEKINDGIMARAHDFLIAPPTPEQACTALRRIAAAEDIKVTDEKITEIVRTSSRIPRECLKALQRQIIK